MDNILIGIALFAVPVTAFVFLLAFYAVELGASIRECREEKKWGAR